MIAEFPSGGGKGEGLEGVQDYIRGHRQDDFLRNLARGVLAYALSRSLQLSDEPLVEQAVEEWRRNDFRFAKLFETIVTSPQFLNRRDPAAVERSSASGERGE